METAVLKYDKVPPLWKHIFMDPHRSASLFSSLPSEASVTARDLRAIIKSSATFPLNQHRDTLSPVTLRVDVIQEGLDKLNDELKRLAPQFAHTFASKRGYKVGILGDVNDAQSAWCRMAPARGDHASVMAANLGNTANGNNKKLALWHEWSAVLLCELLLRPLDTYMLLGWYASLKLALEMKIEKSKAKTKGENAEPGDVRNTWVLFVDCLATLLYEQQMEHERVEDALKELFVQLVLLWAYSLIVVGQEVTADIDASASAPHSSHMHISGNLDAKV